MWTLNTGLPMWQHENPYVAGYESIDPAPYWNGNRWERNSDASFFPLASGVVGHRGGILKTTDRRSALSGESLTTVGGSHAYINMVGWGTPVYGGALEKIGKTSGWTYGTVTNTCYNTNLDETHNGQGTTLMCSTLATTVSGLGDSGGPAFYWDGEDGGVFYGLVTGMSGGYGVYSTNGIQTDLGTLNVVTDITIGTPSPTGSVVSGYPHLAWDSVSVSGSSLTTSYRVYKWAWDASIDSWTQQGQLVQSSTSRTFDEAVSVNAYVGNSAPDPCTYSFVYYIVRAYNNGVSTSSDIFAFRGAANGTPPCS